MSGYKPTKLCLKCCRMLEFGWFRWIKSRNDLADDCQFCFTASKGGVRKKPFAPVDHGPERMKLLLDRFNAKPTPINALPFAERMRRAKMRKFAGSVRGLVMSALVRRGVDKSERTEKILGCSIASFRRYTELQFLPGMTWENRHLWHIDHIVPMATAKTKADAIALNHFTNLRPLWAADNLAKRDKVLFLL